MRDKRKIRDVVKMVLIADKKARNSDKYLYTEVVRRLNPNLIYKPLAIALTEADLPNMETVRRNRQWLQAHFPELKASDNVQAQRELNEIDCREFFGYGR